MLLRLLQGLALGGEYGGAATYVAEHVPDDKRGYYTSFIQTTATIGFFVSMGVIGTTRLLAGEAAFKAWGWRVPFLLSFVLLAVSLYIRVSMKESPLFAKMKSEGKTSKNPLAETFTNPKNLKYVAIALFGVTAGQGVVWYTGQFYALTFLQTALKLDWKTAYVLVSIALALATPLFVVFGRLSDRIGRKKLILGGCALGALTYVPIFMALKHFSNPSGLPAADPAEINYVAMVVLLFLQMVYVCMVYGPIAAFLVELFPTKIRYTSMSFPYHFGNGWFGGFLPLIATAVTASAWAKGTFGAGGDLYRAHLSDCRLRGDVRRRRGLHQGDARVTRSTFEAVWRRTSSRRSREGGATRRRSRRSSYGRGSSTKTPRYLRPQTRLGSMCRKMCSSGTCWREESKMKRNRVQGAVLLSTRIFFGDGLWRKRRRCLCAASLRTRHRHRLHFRRLLPRGRAFGLEVRAPRDRGRIGVCPGHPHLRSQRPGRAAPALEAGGRPSDDRRRYSPEVASTSPVAGPRVFKGARRRECESSRSISSGLNGPGELEARSPIYFARPPRPTPS